MSIFAWENAAPAAWELIDPEYPGAGRLRIGSRVYRLDDVVAIEPSSVTEINIDGHLMTVAFFMAVGCIFMLPVVMAYASPKFLAGTVLFFGIGVMVLVDVMQGHRHVIHRLEISFADGSTTRFASVDLSVCEKLEQALTRRLTA